MLSAVLMQASLGPGHAAEWRLPGARAVSEPEAGLELRGEQLAFRPFEGLGPVFTFGGPGEYAAEVLAAEATEAGYLVRYRAAARGETAEYTVTISTAGAELRLRVQSDSPLGRGVTAGLVQGAGRWRRYCLTRTQEPHGQHWWTKTNYLPEAGLFLSAEWLYEGSHASGWEAPDATLEGDGPFAAAPALVYAPRTDGSYAPVDETLALRVADRLEEAMPRPRQRPSEYRAELGPMVYLDLWGGSARELRHSLELIRRASRGEQRFLTILQPWEVGGWDALLPDSIRMPDYAPDPRVGSVEELRELCALGEGMGRFGFRTNYMVLREQSPSFQQGRARHALEATGEAKWHTGPCDWLGLIARQETEIRELWAPNASFTDQLTSGGAPTAWLDADAARGPLAGTIGETLALMQQMARRIKATHDGPLGSESLIDQYLLGEFVDFGDFGIMDGYHRAPCPEYHLRVMRNWAVFHGMGLCYRFLEPPPFPEYHHGRYTFWQDRAQQDDYRCMEVLYGNGGYLMYEPSVPWPFVLTEVLLVGRLQPYYATAAVTSVEYLQGERWRTLQEMIADGFIWAVEPWAPQPPEFRRARVRYDSGLTVVANRATEPLQVEAAGTSLALPPSGWAAWLDDASVLAYSALHPATGTRVDLLRDSRRGFQYLDPRGVEVEGVSVPTAWQDGQAYLSLREDEGVCAIEGDQVPLRLPAPPPRTELRFTFDDGAEGWQQAAGVLTMAAEGGVLRVKTVTEDPQLVSPPLRLRGDEIGTVVVRLRTTAGEMGQLYWMTEAEPGTSEERVLHLRFQPGGEFVECRLPVGEHPKWRGQVITGLRLDPVHGPLQAEVEIDGIWEER